MRNPFKALARLWPNTQNEVIGQLYTYCLGRPLLVEPRMGAQLLSAYMHGPLLQGVAPGYLVPSAAATVVALGPNGEAQDSGRRIAVMNISGGLASRPMPGPSGGGPQNYEQLSAAFEELVEARDVDAIVLRMDSPGGFVDGLFDLTDQIHAAREKKPVHAVVDHMAYSAAYAIASAASEIWVNRTAGVGSIGAVAYHVDQSEANKAEGIKITPVYAGSRKIDFSPHFPLTEEALALEQAEINRVYDLFVESVGRYRGEKMDAKKARATEAGLSSGQLAIDAGFADRLGTLHDALAFLASNDRVTLPAKQHANAEGEQMDATALAQQKKGALAIALTSAKLPATITAALLAADVEPADVEARIAHAREIIEVCNVAKVPELAEGFVAKHTTLDAARAEIQAKKTAEDEARKTETTLPAVPAVNRKPGLWDKAIRKLGGKL